MDNVDPDLVNLLDTQADQTDVTNVHLRSTQEDTRMLEPDDVDRRRKRWRPPNIEMFVDISRMR